MTLTIQQIEDAIRDHIRPGTIWRDKTTNKSFIIQSVARPYMRHVKTHHVIMTPQGGTECIFVNVRSFLKTFDLVGA